MQDEWRVRPITGEPPRLGGPRRDGSLLDLNLLPARHRRRPIQLADVAPLLATLGLLILLAPVISRFQEANQSFQRTQSELASQEQILEGRGELQSRVDQMEADLQQLTERVSAMRSSQETFQIQAVAWNEPLASIKRAVPAGTGIVRIEHHGGQIRLVGESDTHRAVFDYLKNLTGVEGVQSITIDRIERLTDAPGTTELEGEETELESPRFQFEFVLSMSSSNELSAGNGQDPAESGEGN